MFDSAIMLFPSAYCRRHLLFLVSIYLFLFFQHVLTILSATDVHRPVIAPGSTCSHVTTWMARAVARQAGKAVPVMTT